MTKEEFVEKAVQLVTQTPIITIASIDEDGFPRPVPMAQLKADGIKTIWFSTGTSSAKVKHYLNNPKAGVVFHNNDDCVALTGKMEVVTDADIKKELWQDWMINHFPKGVEDPELILLKFTSMEMTSWINCEFIKASL